MAPLHESVHTDRARAESFGSIADDYDRYRTSYPDALFVDLVNLAPERVLDIACGTGKVAVALLACGLAVLGVEPDPKMAEVARGHGILVEVSDFETWDDGGRRFPLITCGQGWHWIDPVAGPRKAAQLLEPDGRLVLFWSYPDFPDALAERFDAVYAEHAPQLLEDKAGQRDDTPHVAPLEASGLFAGIDTHTYRWTRTFTTQEWVRRSATFSDHHLLPDEQREAVLAGIGTVIDEQGGSLDVEFATYTIFARTPEK